MKNELKKLIMSLPMSKRFMLAYSVLSPILGETDGYGIEISSVEREVRKNLVDNRFFSFAKMRKDELSELASSLEELQDLGLIKERR